MPPETRIVKLEITMAELAKLTSDHERRIRRIEQNLAYGVGAIGAIGFLLKVFKVI